MIDRFRNLSYLKPIMATMWQRKSGTFYVYWSEDGRRRAKSLKTKDDAKAIQRFNNFKRDLRNGKIKPISPGIRQTLVPFTKEFLDYVSATTAPTTYECYETALKKAKDSWGNIPLSHVTNRHLDKLIQDMIEAGLARATVNKNYRHIKAALKKARKWKYILHEIDWPKQLKVPEEIRYLTVEQLRKVILQIHDPEFADLVWFAAHTGLRNSEIVRLQWYDIDNPEGFIRIISMQKNRNEDRIPITKHARSILDRCRARKGKKVFRYQTRQTVSKAFKKAAREAGFKDIRFHDLRHTYGSHLAMESRGGDEIQSLMRHRSSVSTKVYTKLRPEALVEAANSIDYGPMPLPSKPKKSKS